MAAEAPYTAEGYRYRVTDQSGVGYYIEPGQGQFGDGGTGDNAYMYLTQHHASEGDSDMPLLPNTGCCNNNYMQGPQSYIDGESTTDQNIVLWYVPQSETITTWAVQNGYGDAQYCWTDNTSNYWPCFSGPMFVPIPESPPTAVSLSTLAANDGLEPTQGGFTLVLVLAAGLSMAIATGFLLRRRNLAAQQASNVLDRH